jgi:hypothetical protein
VSRDREILLTLTDAEQEQLQRDVAELRRKLGLSSATAVILKAVREQAEATMREAA